MFQKRWYEILQRSKEAKDNCLGHWHTRTLLATVRSMAIQKVSGRNTIAKSGFMRHQPDTTGPVCPDGQKTCFSFLIKEEHKKCNNKKVEIPWPVCPALKKYTFRHRPRALSEFGDQMASIANTQPINFGLFLSKTKQR